MELPVLNDTIECSCTDCVSACKKKPGWFAPGEIKPAADLLGMSEEKEFFDKYLSVDYWGNPDSWMFVLSPATLNATPGQEFPLDPTGQCVFLKEDGKCSIHEAKPYECKSYDHRKKESEADLEQASKQHLSVAEAWASHKDYIANLLGREPEVSPPNPLEMLQFLFSMVGKCREAQHYPDTLSEPGSPDTKYMDFPIDFAHLLEKDRKELFPGSSGRWTEEQR